MLEETQYSTTRIWEEEWQEGHMVEGEGVCWIGVRLYGGWALSFLD
jgi:hypothetical protein